MIHKRIMGAKMLSTKEGFQKKKKELQELRSAVEAAEREIDKLSTKLVQEQVKEKIANEYTKWLSEPFGLNRWVLVQNLCENNTAAELELKQTKLFAMGINPWGSDDLVAFLSKKKFRIAADPLDAEILIIGNDDCDKGNLYEVIAAALENRIPLKIYSQELFVAWMITGQDPLIEWHSSELLKAVENHGGMNMVLEYDDLEWPNEISFSDNSAVFEIDASEWSGESLLHKYGYNVKDGTLSEKQRQSYLEDFYHGQLSKYATASSDIKKWGAPSSAQRLYALAQFLTWLIKFQGKSKPRAADKWMGDLTWLKTTFYNSRMKFAWPKILVGESLAAIRSSKTKAKTVVHRGEEPGTLNPRIKPKINQIVYSTNYGWGKVISISGDVLTIRFDAYAGTKSIPLSSSTLSVVSHDLF
jgi:hypothetical protein